MSLTHPLKTDLMASTTRKKIQLHCGSAKVHLESAQTQLSTIAELSSDRSEVIEEQLPLIMAGLQSVIEATEALYYRL